jgi:hypothetical protein
VTSSEGFASIHRQAGRQKRAADKIIDLEEKAPARSARTHGPGRRWRGRPGIQATVKSSIRQKSPAIKNRSDIVRHRTSPTRRGGTRQVLASSCVSKISRDASTPNNSASVYRVLSPLASTSLFPRLPAHRRAADCFVSLLFAKRSGLERFRLRNFETEIPSSHCYE